MGNWKVGPAANGETYSIKGAPEVFSSIESKGMLLEKSDSLGTLLFGLSSPRSRHVRPLACRQACPAAVPGGNPI